MVTKSSSPSTVSAGALSAAVVESVADTVPAAASPHPANADSDKTAVNNVAIILFFITLSPLFYYLFI